MEECEERNLYQYSEILCECGYDYNEDKNLWSVFDNLKYWDVVVLECPSCKKQNKIELDYIYIGEFGEEFEQVCMCIEQKDKR